MSTKVHRRSSSPSHNARNSDSEGGIRSRDSSLDRQGQRGKGHKNRNQDNERDQSPDQSNNEGITRNEGGRSNRKGTKQQQQSLGFWPSLEQKAVSILPWYLRFPLKFFKTPMQWFRNGLKAAVAVTILSVLVGALILGYTIYSVRQHAIEKEGLMPKMQRAMHDMGFPTSLSASKSKGRFQDAADSAKDAFVHGVDSMRKSGEGYLDSAIHGIEGTAAPIKDAFLHAKDKVAEVAGFSQSKAEGVIDSAKHQLQDFASSALKSVEGMTPSLKKIIDSTTDFFSKGGEDLTEQIKSYTASVSQKASRSGEDVSKLVQSKREELAIKAKKNIDKQSVEAKRKVDEAAVAAKKRVDDLAYAAKKAADKAAGHSSWKLW